VTGALHLGPALHPIRIRARPQPCLAVSTLALPCWLLPCEIPEAITQLVTCLSEALFHSVLGDVLPARRKALLVHASHPSSASDLCLLPSVSCLLSTDSCLPSFPFGFRVRYTFPRSVLPVGPDTESASAGESADFRRASRTANALCGSRTTPRLIGLPLPICKHLTPNPTPCQHLFRAGSGRVSAASGGAGPRPAAASQAACTGGPGARAAQGPRARPLLPAWTQPHTVTRTNQRGNAAGGRKSVEI
jgi:hypothetical protein